MSRADSVFNSSRLTGRTREGSILSLAGQRRNVDSPRISTWFLARSVSLRRSVTSAIVYFLGRPVFASVGGVKAKVPSGGLVSELKASPVSFAYHSITSFHGLLLMVKVTRRCFGAETAGVAVSFLGS